MVTSANVYLKHILFWQGIMFMARSRRALLHTLSGNKEDPLAEEEEIKVSDRASIDGIRRKYAAE